MRKYLDMKKLRCERMNTQEKTELSRTEGEKSRFDILRKINEKQPDIIKQGTIYSIKSQS